MSNAEPDDTTPPSPAKIALIGCGWWSQGWHLPHLGENENSKIVALVDINPHPTSPLNPDLASLQTLSETYGNPPIFSSTEELLEANVEVDGVLVATPHATHAKIGKLILQHSVKQPKPIHIMMEKPMTTCVEEAKELYDAVLEAQKASAGIPPSFLVNHSANFRKQCLTAHTLVQGQAAIGKVQHIAASFASPLMWIFDNPANPGWNEPTHTMLGNGFAWGQQSHLLAWIYYVTGVIPLKVSCHMHHSSKTGADLSHAATIYGKAAHHHGENDDDDDVVVMSLSGTTLLPGNAHSDHGPIGKEIHLCIYGSEGAIRYCGTDSDPSSGQLELRRVGEKDGHPTFPCEDDGGFLFENLDTEGAGPESLQAFIAACQGKSMNEPPAADVTIGLRTIQTLDAMYRSHHSGQIEKVKYI